MLFQFQLIVVSFNCISSAFAIAGRTETQSYPDEFGHALVEMFTLDVDDHALRKFDMDEHFIKREISQSAWEWLKFPEDALATAPSRGASMAVS